MSIITDWIWLHWAIKASEFLPSCHVSSGLVWGSSLQAFSASLGLWFHLKRHLVPTTPAKTLLNMQTSSTRSVKIHFSVSTNRNKTDGSKNSYTNIKHYDNFEYWGISSIMIILNIGEFCFSGCIYCFFIKVLQYLQKHYCLVDSI